MIHVAAQFASYFHTHHFKCRHAFEEILSLDKLKRLLDLHPNFVLIDVGCGSGAASTAFLSTVTALHHNGELRAPVRIEIFGLDPSMNALGIYYQLMNHIVSNLNTTQIEIRFHIIYKPIAESLVELDIKLRNVMEFWQKPALSNVALVQSNVLDPFSQEFNADREQFCRLVELGVEPNRIVSYVGFGVREAHAYHDLFQQLPMDNLFALTVGTKNSDIQQLVKKMGKSLQSAFSKHEPRQLCGTNLYHIKYENPRESFWMKVDQQQDWTTKYCVDLTSVNSIDVNGDGDWHKVLDISNLELAWARARAIHQREVLYDEIEIRLFERNRKANLKRLHKELVSYDANIARSCGRLQFSFVKNAEESRPRVLSRMEEDIVSIAIVQVLGSSAFALNSTSYAYRPNPRFASRSEFLYEYWFPAYQLYKSEAENAVAKHSNCMVSSIDIKSYFKNIPQRELVESVQKEIRSHSERIRWLLQRIICGKLENHKEHHGLSQGGAGSGFYANTYLTEFDKEFGINNRWDAQLFRFVDDIVIVIPNPHDLGEVKDTAENTLQELGLKANPFKSKDYLADEFLNLANDDGKMEKLSKRFERLCKPLWCTNRAYHGLLEQEGIWWSRIDIYRNHLKSIEHYIEPHRLSRKLDQYQQERRVEGTSDELQPLSVNLPDFDSPKWAEQFISTNSKWIKERDTLRTDLVQLVLDSYRELETVTCPAQKRLLSTRIYFSANRLSSIGYGAAVDPITDILVEKPWIIRQPQYTIRGLAIQGYSEQINRLFEYYVLLNESWASSFLAVIIRAIRHLEEIPDELEGKVIQIAVDNESKEVLKLMATETWLMKLNCVRVAKHEAEIRQFLSTEQSARVRKNYLLLLGKCKHDIPQHPDDDDPLLRDAIEIAHSGDVEELFEREEPDILRERYYSRYYPDRFSDYNDDGHF